MANTLEFIIKATDQASKVVAGIEDKITGSTSKIKLSLTDIKSGFEIAGMAVKALGAAYDFLAADTVAYAKESKDLAATLQLTTQETQKLIQVADDYGIEQGALTSALQIAVKNGFKPSIENLAKLADETNKITDVNERADAMVKIFGRGWSTLVPMLTAGGDAMRAGASEAEAMGLVLSDVSMNDMELMRKKTDELTDRWEGFKNKVSSEVVPVLLDIADGVSYFAESITPATTEEARLRAEVIKSYSAFYDNTEGINKASEALRNYLWRQQEVGIGTQAYADVSYGEYIPALKDSRSAGDDLVTAILAEEAAMKRASDAAHDLAVDGYAMLKIAMAGLIQKENIQFLKQEEDLATKAAKLKEEIDKLSASQGRAVTVTSKANMTDSERAVVIAKLAVVNEDLATAQKKEKESDAEFALRMANNAASAEDLSGKLGNAATSVTRYVDNSKKINELTGQYDEINAEIEANAAAHEDATRRILFGYAEQNLAIGGLTDTEMKALDALAVKWGLKSQEDIAAMEAIRQAGENLANDGNIDKYVKNVAGQFDSLKEATSFYKGDLASIPKEIYTTLVLKAKMDELASQLGSIYQGHGGPTRDSGGATSVGVPYMIGAGVRETFVPQQAGIVLPPNITTSITNNITTDRMGIALAMARSQQMAAEARM